MKIDRFTEEELQKSNLLDEGAYPFRVIESQNTKAQSSGAEMIKLVLQVSDSSGKPRKVFCNLINSWPKLVKHFCDVAGLEQEYDSGELDAMHCINKGGYVKIAIEKGMDKNNKEIYKNVVDDFVGKPIETSEFKDDEIAF